ncbi:sugar phosphate isomerase/epimerase family protein [Danxiaibacter flavus]|uniref:Sugar phosphate isomerase/epimerase family protein n=1 Tax=Danxiaibacter flavus TaxID=3049108 RepID=A0ABV3ZKF5_9BACT|nr:sugar phosphate isomerase/epimerase family protein [Chitinophagaceae bacterium DXS]
MKSFFCSVFFLQLIFAISSYGQKKYQPPFFVFNNGLRDNMYNTAEKQVDLLHSLGYDGMEKEGFDGLDTLLQELDKQQKKLFCIYVNVNLDPGKPYYDARLAETLKKLKGRGTMLWINITSSEGIYPPSSHAGDTAAVRIIRDVADLANTQGIRIILYPHTWLWLERFDHGLQLVEMINRQNVGITFNLPHYLAQARIGEEQQIAGLLKKAGKKLFAVSICGATITEKKDRANIWDSLIQPLGQGNFDNATILKTLKQIKFDGPVGLQCYNIKGDKKAILKQSMDAWNVLIKKIN